MRTVLAVRCKTHCSDETLTRKNVFARLGDRDRERERERYEGRNIENKKKKNDFGTHCYGNVKNVLTACFTYRTEKK